MNPTSRAGGSYAAASARKDVPHTTVPIAEQLAKIERLQQGLKTARETGNVDGLLRELGREHEIRGNDNPFQNRDRLCCLARVIGPENAAVATCLIGLPGLFALCIWCPIIGVPLVGGGICYMGHLMSQPENRNWS